MRIANHVSPAPRRMSTLLAGALFSMSVVVLLIYGGLEMLNTFRSQDALIASRQQLIAQNAAKTVSGFIHENFSLLESTVWLTNFETLPAGEQERLLRRLLGYRPALRQVMFVDHGGKVIAHSSRLSRHASWPQVDYLRSIMPMRITRPERKISPVYIDPVSYEPMVALAVAVTDIFGTLRGSLLAELNLKSMWDIVDRLRVGERGYVYVSDGNGDLLAFYDTARVLRGENVAHIKTVAEFIAARNPDGGPETAAPKKGSRYRGIRGTAVVGTYAPLSVPDWAVVAELPWEEAYREIVSGATRAVLTTLCMAVLAAFFGVFLARRLSAPVISLTDTASRIAAGERDLQAAVAGPHEILKLAVAFNSMTAQLRQMLKEVEVRCADVQRTKEALYLSEERLRHALEGNTDGIWDWNLRSNQAYFSPRWFTMLGYTADAFPGSYESFVGLVHPDDRAAAEDTVQSAIARSRPFAMEIRLKCRQGEWRWVLSRGKVVEWDEAGKPVRMAGSHSDISERKQAEIALREEKRFSDTLIDGLPGTFFVFDRDGRFIRLNRHFENVTGYTLQELEGKDPADFFAREERDKIAARIHEVLTSGESELEADFIGPEGQPIPYYFKGLRIMIGDEPHVLVIGFDVSERKRAEADAKTHQERLALALEGADLGSWDWNIETGQVRFDERWAAMLGYRIDEIEPSVKSWEALVHPEDLPRVRETLNAHLQGETTFYETEHRMKHKSGHWIWIQDRGRVMERGADGGPLRAAGTHLDISERKKAEETLRKYERIVSTTEDMMGLVNHDGIYEAVNESYLKALHKKRDQVVGRGVAEVIGVKPFEEKIRPRLEEALSGKLVRFREVMEYAGLGRRIVDVSYIPMFDPSGAVDGIVFNTRDITETRKLEERLIQSQKIDSLGILAGGVAHEINNPINGIMNYAQLILDRLETPDPQAQVATYASEILGETRRIAGIVRNLLTFARHEKQSHSPALLSDIVASVLSLIKTVMRHDQVILELAIPDDLPRIKCRSQQIQQVLMNLLTNARDALNERYPGHDPQKKLKVSAALIERRQRPYIRMTVEDAGPGIPAHIRNRIFDPFFTTKPKENGTGLGLSISYGILKDHNGELSVESEPGQYTRFHVDLPVDNGWTLPEKGGARDG